MTLVVPTRRWFLVAAGLAVFGPLAHLWPDATGVLVMLDLLWLGLLLADAVLVLAPARLEVRRDAPAAFSVGRELPVTYWWRHPSRRTITVLVREQLPDPLTGGRLIDRRLSLGPGLPTAEVLLLRPVHRGRATGGGLAVRVLGPLGLVWRQGKLPLPWDVTVFPRLAGAALRALPAQAAQRREAGLRTVRRPGEGRMFEGLREWVPGDDTRIIDWKATARRGKPIARQYEDERRQRVLLVIDAGRLLTAESAGVARLDSVVDAALHLAHAVVEHDDDVGLLVFADEVETYVAPARGRRALQAVLEALAKVEGRLVESDYPAAFRFLAAHNRKRALTVLFTDVIDRTASEALVAQAAGLRPRHLPMAVTLRDPELEGAAVARPVASGRGIRAGRSRGAAGGAGGCPRRDARPRDHRARRPAGGGQPGGGGAV